MPAGYNNQLRGQRTIASRLPVVNRRGPTTSPQLSAFISARTPQTGCAALNTPEISDYPPKTWSGESNSQAVIRRM
jgi:hypothetical protein